MKGEKPLGEGFKGAAARYSTNPERNQGQHFEQQNPHKTEELETRHRTFELTALTF